MVIYRGQIGRIGLGFVGSVGCFLKDTGGELSAKFSGLHRALGFGLGSDD